MTGNERRTPGVSRAMVHERPAHPDALVVLCMALNEVVRFGIAAMLEPSEFVVLAADAPETALALMRTQAVDVILLPVSTDDEVLAQFSDCGPVQPHILALIDHLDSATLASVAGKRVDGYLSQTELSHASLTQALRQVAAGEAIAPMALVRQLLEEHRARSAREAVSLTARELDVLGLLAAGMVNKQIARELDISENGVKHHVTSLLAKMNASNRALAVSRAYAMGLLDREPANSGKR